MVLFGFGKNNKRKKEWNKAIELYNVKDYSKAYDMFKQLTKAGIVEARYYCGLICEQQTPPDLYNAVSWYLSAINNGYENAKDAYERTLKELETTDPFLAGNIYSMQKDNTHAFPLFLKAASQDHAQAQYQCAVMYKYGRGTSKDINKAIEWYEKSAALGYHHAQYSCAKMYEEGDEVEKNLSKALYWYEQLAEQGDRDALYKCAKMYKKGEGTKQDLSQALYWYEMLAILHDDEEAQFQCAQMYEKGIGVHANRARAIYWYIKAKRSGSMEAQASLMCLDPQLGDDYNAATIAYEIHDYECAFDLFYKVAKKGNADAQYVIGAMYINGEGTTVDEKAGLYWLNEARNQGQENAIEILKTLGK